MNKTIDQITSIQSLDELSASELASFINLLIKHETKPGGPYDFKVNAAENAIINNHLYYLFLAKGKKLNPIMQSEVRDEINLDKKKVTYDNVYDLVSENLSMQIDSDTLNLVEPIKLKIKQADHRGEISLLSTVFYKSLKSDYQDKIQFTKNVQQKYSFANVYTWITYTLIDKMLDSSIEPHLLPLTYILQRNIVSQYEKAGVDIDLVSSMFSIVDLANMRELSIRNKLTVSTDHSTITINNIDYKDIDSLMWRKSIAHTTGVISLVERVKPTSKELIFKAMQLYCSARQLNDDVHDWQEDLYNGQVTYVISELLKKTKIKPGKYDSIDLLNQLKLTYWNETLLDCSKRIQNDIQEATRILEHNLLNENSEFIKLFLNPISDAAKRAASQNNYEKYFLKQSSS